MAIKKDYYTMYNVGKTKYLVMYYPHFYKPYARKHRDGSKAYALQTFSNKVKFNKWIKEKLIAKGYKRK